MGMMDSLYMDHLYGRVVRKLVQTRRVLTNAQLLEIWADCSRAVSTSRIPWCDNLTMATSDQLVSTWSGRLPVQKNPG